MGEVEQLQNAIDHGVPQSDQGINGAQGETIDQGLGQQLEKGFQGHPGFVTVLRVLVKEKEGICALRDADPNGVQHMPV